MSEANPIPAAAAPVAAVIPPDIQAQIEKLKADNAALLSKEQARADADFQAALAKDFPNIKDFSVVVGATHDEKRAHAMKLNALFAPAAPAPAAAPKATVPASGNPGDTLNIPPMGAPGGEVGKAQAESQAKLELTQAVMRGDVSAAFDKCVELQPEPYKRVVAGAR